MKRATPASGRFCSRCNRRLNTDAHDRDSGGWYCRLRLVGTNRHTGKTMVPNATVTAHRIWPFVQRLVPENNARMVHVSRFKDGELK